MSRFLKALQRMETEPRLTSGSREGKISEEGSSDVPGWKESEKCWAKSSSACSTLLSSGGRTSEESIPISREKPLFKDAAQPAEVSEPRNLEGVIQRLRLRALPGREPGVCQMAAHLLSQLPPGPTTTLVFLGVAGDPPPTLTLAPLAAVVGEALPAPLLGLDARPDCPELAECFGLPCRWTLADVWAGRVALYEAVRKTALGELFVLGGAPPGGIKWSEVTEQAWSAWMEQVRKHYRLILIDGGRHPHPAQKALLACSDGVYLVVHLGRTPKRLLHQTVAELQQAGASVLGCIPASSGKKR